MTKAVLGYLYLYYESPSIKFGRCDLLANVLTKGLFGTSTTETLPVFNDGNCGFDGFLIFGCKLLAELQCGIELFMMYGYNFSRRSFRNVTIENTSASSESICGRQWINAVFNCNSNFNLL